MFIVKVYCIWRGYVIVTGERRSREREVGACSLTKKESPRDWSLSLLGLDEAAKAAWVTLTLCRG